MDRDRDRREKLERIVKSEGVSTVRLGESDEFKEYLRNAGSKLVVVDFFATWCGSGRLVSSRLENMAREFTDAIFLRVDVDEVEEVPKNAGISAMPTVQCYRNGEKIDEYIGANETKLRDMLKRNV